MGFRSCDQLVSRYRWRAPVSNVAFEKYEYVALRYETSTIAELPDAAAMAALLWLRWQITSSCCSFFLAVQTKRFAPAAQA